MGLVGWLYMYMGAFFFGCVTPAVEAGGGQMDGWMDGWMDESRSRWLWHVHDENLWHVHNENGWRVGRNGTVNGESDGGNRQLVVIYNNCLEWI